MSWLRTGGGYELFFNRDERLERGPEQAPAFSDIGGVRYAAPTDTDFGGTWVAVNEHGVTVGLVDDYATGRVRPEGSYTSRGVLVRELAGGAGVDDLVARLRATDLTRFRPFVLLLVEPEYRAAAFAWDGEVGRVDGSPRPPLVSSGADQAEARLRRTKLYRELTAEYGPTVEALARFHASHGDGDLTFSPCMHGREAETRSAVRIAVDTVEARLDWTPAPPCRAGNAETLTLTVRPGR